MRQHGNPKILSERKGRGTVPLRVVQRNGLLEVLPGGGQLAHHFVSRPANPVRYAQSLRVGVLLGQGENMSGEVLLLSNRHPDVLDSPEPIQHGELLWHVAYGLDQIPGAGESGGGFGRGVAVASDARLPEHRLEMQLALCLSAALPASAAAHFGQRSLSAR
ncbi:hypothetical protein BQ8482_120003 [Mesorhizobium delmotii]|uniref:Uncharacterized protein n=1 Tax=Mesorhizobium delmotii TaxID=1631247 RepID=A0A2P9AFP0_9HYPH|nr:hypothetical protein BQ8482_120003 [Mesorhizobium delmotii]